MVACDSAIVTRLSRRTRYRTAKQHAGTHGPPEQRKLDAGHTE